MESPASTQSAVTRCGRFVSYAGITLERLTCSFPNAVGRSAPSASIASSSVSGRPPRCHSRSTHTCFAMPAGLSWPTMATTRGPCNTTSLIRTSSIRSGTPNWRPTAARTFGGINSGQPHVLGWSGALEAFWTGVIAIVTWLGKRQVGKALRLAPRTRFAHRFRNPFDHLGIGASFPRREHPLDHLDCGLDLLIRHRLNAALVLDLHFFRHQHCADLQIRGRRFASNPLEHLAPMLLPIFRQIEQKALVERAPRGLRAAPGVSRHPRQILAFSVALTASSVALTASGEGHCVLVLWCRSHRPRTGRQCRLVLRKDVYPILSGFQPAPMSVLSTAEGGDGGLPVRRKAFARQRCRGGRFDSLTPSRCSRRAVRPWAPPVKFEFDFPHLFSKKVPPARSVGHDSVLFCSELSSKCIALSASRS